MGKSSLFEFLTFINPGVRLVQGQRYNYNDGVSKLVRGLTVRHELIYEWLISYDIPSLTKDIYYLPTLSLRSIGETNKTRGIKYTL